MLLQQYKGTLKTGEMGKLCSTLRTSVLLQITDKKLYNVMKRSCSRKP